MRSFVAFVFCVYTLVEPFSWSMPQKISKISCFSRMIADEKLAFRMRISINPLNSIEIIQLKWLQREGVQRAGNFIQFFIVWPPSCHCQLIYESRSNDPVRLIEKCVNETHFHHIHLKNRKNLLKNQWSGNGFVTFHLIWYENGIFSRNKWNTIGAFICIWFHEWLLNASKIQL